MHAQADDLADVPHAPDLIQRRGQQRVHRTEARRQRPRARRADVQDAQTKEQLPQRLVLARRNAFDQVGGALRAHPFQGFQPGSFQKINIGHRLH